MIKSDTDLVPFLGAGYAIYEMLGTTERCILMEEVLADVMSRWERYRQSTAASLHQHHHIFLFKVSSMTRNTNIIVSLCNIR